MPAYPQSFTRQPATKQRPHHHSAFSQGAVIHLGAVVGARYLSQQVQNPIAKTLIYTLAISGASWLTALLRERHYEQQHERAR
jgi:hypothetical protein